MPIPKKPQDMLEFLRRNEQITAPSRPVLSPKRPKNASTMRDFASRTVEFRVVQVAIAGAIVGLVAILAFVLGLKIGTGPENTGLGAVAPADVWVLRLMAVSDNENGRTKAESVRKQLERLQGEEVTIHPLPSGDELMVAVGAWLSNPGEDPGRYANAHALKREIRELESRDGAKLFKDAEFERLDLGRQDLERLDLERQTR